MGLKELEQLACGGLLDLLVDLGPSFSVARKCEALLRRNTESLNEGCAIVRAQTLAQLTPAQLLGHVLGLRRFGVFPAQSAGSFELCGGVATIVS